MFKTCTTCGDSKPATPEYFFRSSGKLQSQCKPCMKAKQALYDETEEAKRCGRFHRYKQHDRNAGREYGLDREFYLRTTDEPCTYCGTTEEIRGLDRLDNSLGHLKSNVVSCCSECNRIRSNTFTPSEMKLLGAAFAQIRQSRNAST